MKKDTPMESEVSDDGEALYIEKHSCARTVLMFVMTFVYLFFGALAVLCGVYSTKYGRVTLHDRISEVRTRLNVQTQRGIESEVSNLGLKVFHEIPAFLVGYRGDRASFWANLQEFGAGEAVGFRDSFALFGYHQVENILSSPEQPRGRYFGTREVPRQCGALHQLNFLGTGDNHTKIRHFLLDHLPALTQIDPTGEECLALDFGDDAGHSFEELGTDELDAAVFRTLVRTLYKTMFEAPIDAHTLRAFEEYKYWGGSCVLGTDFHDITMGQILKKVAALRNTIWDALATTPVAKRIHAAADVAETEGRLPPGVAGREMVELLVEMSCFAGMLGTSHLATHALHRLRSNPKEYVPLYDEDPLAFLHEEARVDPPVTSVTALTKPGGEEIKLVHIHENVHFKEGTPYQLVLSTANTDPEVFGGEWHSKIYAQQFDPKRPHADLQLSWNGKLGDVKNFTAPRGCPGYKLSMSLAKSIVSSPVFKPSELSFPALEDENRSEHARMATLNSEPPISRQLMYIRRDLPFEQFHEATGLSDFGYMMWIVACVASVGYLKRAHHESKTHLASNDNKETAAISRRFSSYLLASAFMGFGWLFRSHWLYMMSQMFAQVSFSLIYLTMRYQTSAWLGLVYSTWSWFLHGVTMLATTVTLVWFGSEMAPTLMYVCIISNTVATCLGLATILKFYTAAKSQHAKSHTKATQKNLEDARKGLVGTFFYIVGLVISALPFGVGTGLPHLIGRVVMATQYIPRVLPAVLAADRHYKKGNVVFPILFTSEKNIQKVEIACTVVFLIVIGIVSKIAYFAASPDICRWEYRPGEDGYNPATSSLPEDTRLCTSTQLSTEVDLYGRVAYSLGKASVSVPLHVKIGPR